MNEPQKTLVALADEIIAKVEAEPGTPWLIDTNWDGDTQGWWLNLTVHNRQEDGSSVSVYHDSVRLGSDFLYLIGKQPLGPESLLVKKLHKRLRRKYEVILWLPSEQPDDDCPSYFERDQAISCLDCKKPIFPRTSEYELTEVCFHCELERERIAKLQPDFNPNPAGNRFYFAVCEGPKIVDQMVLMAKEETATYLRDHLLTAASIGLPLSLIPTHTYQPPVLNSLNTQLAQHLDTLLDQFQDRESEALSGQKRRRKIPIKQHTIKGRKLYMDPYTHPDALIFELNKLLVLAKKAVGSKRLIQSGNGYINNRRLAILNFLRQQPEQKASIRVLEKGLKLPGKPLDLRKDIKTLRKYHYLLKKQGQFHLTPAGNLVDWTG